ncbi:type II toxin-antitoxin system VapC family toxin [Botrimarina sp.]|uniref:type II toxin-antitoxin system VapC family toxin n=1 Tax=Botrimarina sp. TaxID=2795802 RepID=UPI0032ED8C2E
MRYLVDTCTWILVFKGQDIAIADRLRGSKREQIAVCSVVRAELLHGARKYKRRDRRVEVVEKALSACESFPFDDAAAEVYAAIRHSLELRGERIGPNDLMIASIALARDLTLVTTDSHFHRVGGLRVEDWRTP